MSKIRAKIGLTFDDVSLVPRYSKVVPKDVDVSTKLTDRIRLFIPIVSAAMDTVTESDMAIALAREGGIGIIHKNMSIEDQAKQVRRVKLFESTVVQKPITLHPEQRLRDVKEKMKKYGITGFPVVNEENKLLGILTKRDIEFEKDLEKKVKDMMTKDNLVTAKVGISIEEAKQILGKTRKEKLPLIDDKGCLMGLITRKDITKREIVPWATKDEHGRLRVGAAVGVGEDMMERAEALVEAGCDVLVVDTAHAHSKNVILAARRLKDEFTSGVDLIVGNVVTKEAVKVLCKIGVDAIKVGIGPGSICTTRVIAGVGVPQLTAIMDCAEVSTVPIIADGGIRWSGDIAKALAAGACTVMLGNLLAGTDEAPGETILYEGRKYKVYRAMGSLEAMEKGSADRYFQEGVSKFVPEGIVGMVPYKGPVSDIIFQLIGGLKSGMGYCGAKTISKLHQKKRKFIQITKAGEQEGHPHSLAIIKDAPNYSVSVRRSLW